GTPVVRQGHRKRLPSRSAQTWGAPIARPLRHRSGTVRDLRSCSRSNKAHAVPVPGCTQNADFAHGASRACASARKEGSRRENTRKACAISSRTSSELDDQPLARRFYVIEEGFGPALLLAHGHVALHRIVMIKDEPFGVGGPCELDGLFVGAVTPADL